jgi:hypothetical protein
MARAERLAGRRDKAFAYQPVAPDADILAKLAELADASERRFTVNWDMFTTEVLYIDHVYYPRPPEYRWYCSAARRLAATVIRRSPLRGHPRIPSSRALCLRGSERDIAIRAFNFGARIRAVK